MGPSLLTSFLDRRQAILGISSAALIAGLPGNAMSRVLAKPPNVIFIMADDLGYADLSCTGSRHIKTPAIDSIAAQGITLHQGYSSTPVCSPTRTALLLGCYAQRFAVGIEEPIASNAPLNLGPPLDRPTIASVFQALGYRTKLVGKWHLGEPGVHGPLQHGYDEFFGIVEGAADYFRHNMVAGGKEVGIGLARDNAKTEASGYLTDLFGDEAVRSIEASGNKPLFMSLHFNAPHWPWEGREDEAASRTIANSRHNDGGSLAKYREMVEVMDDNVAKVLAALERTGKAPNTIVVFTSDNGGERFSETWPFIGKKGEVLEGGIRVPLLVRWTDQIEAGSSSEQVMASMDFLPTLVAMAGGSIPKANSLDGLDLSAQLIGRAPPVERTLFWRFNAGNQAAVRKGAWKYVKLGGKERLFNLAEDVHERADRSTAEPAKFNELRQLWDQWNAQMLPYRTGGFSENIKDTYSDRY